MKDINKSRQFFLKLHMPDGAVTNGITDHTPDPAILGIDDGYMAGKRVLDIGASDGYWTFWSEMNGAEQAVAIDVEGFENYDWGQVSMPPNVPSPVGGETDNFLYLKSEYGFKAERFINSVYELDKTVHGTFDVVFFYGVLYHLRHPLLAFDKIRSVCQGVVFLETHLNSANNFVPSSVFYRDDVFGITNWTGPSQACVVQWMVDAGFPYVFRERQRKGPLRGRFIGCISEDASRAFLSSRHFVLCDEVYFQRVRIETEREIERAKTSDRSPHY